MRLGVEPNAISGAGRREMTKRRWGGRSKGGT